VLERNLGDEGIEIRLIDVRLDPFVLRGECLDKTSRASVSTLFVIETIPKNPLEPRLSLVGIHPLKKRSMRQSPEERLLDQIISAVQSSAETECIPHQSIPMFLEQV
jgi:hypothetical protein